MQANMGAQGYKGQVPNEGALAWECTDYLSDKIGQHSQSLPHLMRIMKDLQKTLDKTRTAYNQALQERDDERARLQEAENRLESVQRVVQRYAGVQEPVVASDGFTYERNVIQQYLSECKSTETNAYSQQTKEVLTNSLVPNESLKKLVDLLRQVRPTEIAPASKATSIPPYRAAVATGGNINFLEEEDSSAKAGKRSFIHASDLEAGLNKNDVAPKRDEAKKTSEDRPAKSGKAPALHPCLRVYGFCNFKDDCSFAKYPYDACLNYIKGKCRFGDGCKELHVNLKEGKYANAGARHSDPTSVAPTAPYKRSEAPAKEAEKKEVKPTAAAAPTAKDATKTVKK